MQSLLRTAAVAIILGLVTSCGSATTPSQTVAALDETWDLVYISDSSGWGVADQYAARIEEDLGVGVQVHDLWQGVLPAGSILEALRGETRHSTWRHGAVELRPFIEEAEIIVIYGNPNLSETETHPWDWNCALSLEISPACEESTSCGAETFTQYEADLGAIYEEIFSIRNGEPVVLRTADWYLPWGPLQTWRECGNEEVCKECWQNFADSIHRAAEEHDVPVARLLETFSGPDLEEEMAREYIKDDVHPSEEGAVAIADVIADLGYEPVFP